MAAVAVSTTDEQIVVFRLDDESFGLDIFRISEIIKLRDITQVPKTAPHIRGLVNLRGKTIPVVDLRERFGLAAQEDSEQGRIIIVESGAGLVGLVVDQVREVVTLTSDQIQPTPTLVTSLSTDFVRGVAKTGNELVTLLDLDRTLDV